jgi:hypothetical protein
MELHIHGFECLQKDFIGEYNLCGRVICLDGCLHLWVAQLFEILRINTAVIALMNNAPSLASAAEEITARIICNMLSTAQLLVGISSFPAMNMCPWARLQAFGPDR